MNWEAVAAIAELIGALAVVITVAYLAVQIRQNTKTAQSLVQQGMLDNIHSLRLALSQDPELARLLIKANQDYESLASDEALRFEQFALDFMSMWSHMKLQHERSLLADELWQHWDAGFRNVFEAPAFRRVWDSGKASWPSAFRRHVDGVG